MSHGDGGEITTARTVREAVRGFVQALNEALQGKDHLEEVPKLDAEEILEAVMVRTKDATSGLGLTVDESMLDRAMQFLLEWVLRIHGVPIVLPSDDELTLEAVGLALMNCAIASQGMDETPREFLRRPKTVAFLREILIIFTRACIDPDLKEVDDKDDAEEVERYFWGEAAGIILGNAALAEMYTKALAAQADIVAFTALVRPKIVALEGDVTLANLKRILQTAEHKMAMGRSSTNARGGSA